MEIIKSLKVIDTTSEGLGVAKLDNTIIFIKNALIEDVVDVEITKKNKNFYNGIVNNYIKKSKFRNDRFPSKFENIYPFINLDYEKELSLKKNIILNNLKKFAKINLDNIEIIKSENEFNYRNKIELKINDKFNLCYCTETAEKIEIDNCPVTDKKINEFLPFLQEKIKRFKITAYEFNTNKGILKNISIRANCFGELIITFVVKESSENLINFVKSLEERENLIAAYISINSKNKNLLMESKINKIFVKKKFKDKIGKYIFNISSKSFFQVNKFQTEKLYNIAKEFLKSNNDNNNLLDLYSGIGTTTIYFSDCFKTSVGVEVVKDSIKDSIENADLNKIKNIQFIYGKSEEKIEKILKENKIDIISLDPPRKGLNKKVIETIISSNIRKIVYISCNSATLSRDIKLFIDNGFELKNIKAVDMFSKTAHVETVALLSKLDVDKHIDVEIKLDELDLTSAESKATYEQIKEYVKEKFGFKVSTLYIAQIKRKCGIVLREHYNKSKKEKQIIPKCTPEKEKAIMDALKHFKMV